MTPQISKEASEVKDLIPSMNVSLPTPTQQNQDEKVLVSDEALLGIYNEILTTIKEDTKEIDDTLNNFANLMWNEGDASTSTKEALVRLIEIKSGQSEKLTKVADLLTRIKLKERDTFPRYLAANQNNTINIGDGGKRALLEALEKAKKNIKKEEE
jgi:hypothetical protein